MIKKTFEKRKGYIETINLDVSSMLEKINIDKGIEKRYRIKPKVLTHETRVYMRTASNFDSNRLRVDTETDFILKEYRIERRACIKKTKSIITAETYTVYLFVL